MKTLRVIRNGLRKKAEKEAMKLYRLARKAEKHGCSQKLVKEIRDEALWLNITGTAYPERMIEEDFQYKFHFAFRTEGAE